LPTNNASEFDDLYAKVLDKPAETEGCFRLRFTSKSPEATAALDRLRQEAIEKASV
jgi:hypothetical protein